MAPPAPALLLVVAHIPGLLASAAQLTILPSDHQEVRLGPTPGGCPDADILPLQVRLGASLVLTCTAHASSLELVRDLEWRDPRGRPVPQDGRSAARAAAAGDAFDFEAQTSPGFTRRPWRRSPA